MMHTITTITTKPNSVFQSSFISREPTTIGFSSFVSDPNRVCFGDDQEFCSCDDCSTPLGSTCIQCGETITDLCMNMAVILNNGLICGDCDLHRERDAEAGLTGELPF